MSLEHRTKSDPIPHLIPAQEQRDHLDVSEADRVLTERYREASSDDILLQRREQMSRIKEREPLDIERNTERALAGIERFYVDKQTSGKRGMRKALSQARELRKLHSKADAFAKAFDETLFSDIEHSAPDFGDDIELKSPAVLAQESGVSIKEAVRHTGTLDIAMGQTDYIFANTGPLKSLAGRGRNLYRITSDNGYVVPTDIGVMYPTKGMYQLGDQAVMELQLYADNIHTISGFKKVFALYSAALFESPDDALGFYQTFKHVMGEAKRWELDEEQGWPQDRWTTYGPHNQQHGTELGSRYADQDGKGNDRTHAVALSMRELLEQYDIYPPMEPEFQFRDRVTATRIR